MHEPPSSIISQELDYQEYLRDWRQKLVDTLSGTIDTTDSEALGRSSEMKYVH